MTELERELARVDRRLQAARVLLSAGLPDEATSQSYFTAFYAARAALTTVGISRAKHSGTIAAFGKHVVREGGLDPEVGAILRVLFESRNLSDYGPGTTPTRRARIAVESAERFVDGVRAWLDERGAK